MVHRKSITAKRGEGSCSRAGRRWLAVLGSVGQPRDGNPAASFAMFDTSSRAITYCRGPYDVEAAVSGFAKTACRIGWPIACWSGGERWPNFRFNPAVIDGFTIGERFHSGGMATLWSVTRPGIDVPLPMKIPRVSEGEDPGAIVSFEMEQMILPRLSGPHVPACFATGDFARQAHVMIEAIPGTTLYSRLGDLPLAYSMVLRRRFNDNLTHPRAKADLAAQLASGPIVAVALDTAEGSDALNEGYASPPRGSWRRFPRQGWLA